MFRKIRKKQNEISVEQAKQLLINERRAVLALNGDDGYPYAVPINFWYCEADETIYFHGSRTGHKVDSLKRSDKVCLTVYGNEQIKDEPWAPFVQSAVVFGRCRLIQDQERAVELVRQFACKYYPDKNLVEEEIAVSGKAVQMYALSVEHISGKEVQER